MYNPKPIMMLLATIVLATACDSDNNAPQVEDLTAISLGSINVTASAIDTRAAISVFENGQRLTATATPTETGETYTATWEYATGSGWAVQGTPMYYENVHTGYNFAATIGTQSLVTDQSTVAAFTNADYIKGVLQLVPTPGSPSLDTGSTPLTHQHVEIDITLTQGDGWVSPTWAEALEDIDFTFYTSGSATAVTPLVNGTNFRVRIPLSNVPAVSAKLFSININGQNKNGSYTLSAGKSLTAGTRLMITLPVHYARQLDVFEATITGWEPVDGGTFNGNLAQAILPFCRTVFADSPTINPLS